MQSQVELMRINLKVEALICSLFKYKWLPTLSIRSIIRSAHACDVSLGARRRAFLSQHSWLQPLRGEPGTSLNSAQSYVFLLRDWFNIFQLSLKTSWCSLVATWSFLVLPIDKVHHTLAYIDRNLPVGDNRGTVKTSTTPHISDQLGTENAYKTLLWWVIVMIRVLVCNNMYRYKHHFGSFYHNPTILEAVSIHCQ